MPPMPAPVSRYCCHFMISAATAFSMTLHAASRHFMSRHTRFCCCRAACCRHFFATRRYAIYADCRFSPYFMPPALRHVVMMSPRCLDAIFIKISPDCFLAPDTPSMPLLLLMLPLRRYARCPPPPARHVDALMPRFHAAHDTLYVRRY